MWRAARRLNDAERRVWSAFDHGAEVDLSEARQPIRAAVLADLLARAVDRAAHPRAALRLRSARVVGGLDLRNAEITVPVSIDGCAFTDVPDLTEARAVSVRLTDCVLPGLRARLLELRGDLLLRRCELTGPVDVRDVHVGGTFTLDGARLSKTVGAAVPAVGPSIALAAARITVAGNLHARAGFTANGQLWLDGAKIGGNVDLDGAVLRNPGGAALSADRLTVAGSLTARDGFTADGDLQLFHAQIGNQLNFTNAELRSADRYALHLGGARVGSLWLTFATRPAGRVRLSGLQADSIFDDPRTWPTALDLHGSTYRLLVSRASAPSDEPSLPVQVAVQERLDWLRRSPDGYTPQPYEQLADQYRRTGHDAEARRVLLEKHRRRRTTLRLPGRLLGYLLDGLVGYGYRTWLAGVWLVAFWALGTLTFIVHPSVPRNRAEAPAHNPTLQALDLLLPIVNLGHDNAWKPAGAGEYIAPLLILAGWVLTTAVVAGLTRNLNR